MLLSQGSVPGAKGVPSPLRGKQNWSEPSGTARRQGTRSSLHSVPALSQNSDYFYRWRRSQCFLCTPLLFCRAGRIFQLHEATIKHLETLHPRNFPLVPPKASCVSMKGGVTRFFLTDHFMKLQEHSACAYVEVFVTETPRSLQSRKDRVQKGLSLLSLLGNVIPCLSCKLEFLFASSWRLVKCGVFL